MFKSDECAENDRICFRYAFGRLSGSEDRDQEVINSICYTLELRGFQSNCRVDFGRALVVNEIAVKKY